MSFLLRRFSFSCVLLFNLALISGCGEKSEASAGGGAGKTGGGKGGKGSGGPAPVIVSQAHRKVVPLVIDAIGAVEPIRAAAIRAQLTGVVQKIAIKEGQDVAQGDLLFDIDPRPLQNAIQSAQADREKITVQLDNARAQVTRYRTLSAESMVSKEQFQKIQDDERALTAQLQASEAVLANARLQLDYASIHAPLAGRTGNIAVHEGDLVRANEVTTPMVTINQLSPIYVTFGVPQQNLAALTRYRAAGTLKVKVTPPGSDERPEEGVLTFMDNMVDPTTGTLKLKATFENKDHRLWPGQFATVNVTLDEPEVLSVPTSAVQTAQTGQNVFVVKADKTAELRGVVVERTYGDDAVVTKGLNEGETVVVDGQLRVVPGKPVEIKDPAGTSAGAGGSGKGGKKGEGKKGEPKKGKEGEKA